MNRYYASIVRKPNDAGQTGTITREYEAATPEAALALAETELADRHEDDRYKVSHIKLRVWPVPTVAAKNRARTHQWMANTYKNALVTAASEIGMSGVKIVEQEISRQERMVKHFQYHYGPNAGL